MARRTLAARGESIRLIPSWRSGLFGVEAAGEVLLPARRHGSHRPRLIPGSGQSATAPSGS